jgi:hypothetical protein
MHASSSAVQEERQAGRVETKIVTSHLISNNQIEPEPESTSCYNAEMPPESILGAEEASEALLNNLMVSTLEIALINDTLIKVECNELHSEESLKWQIGRVVDWAMRIPNFTDLNIHDQSLLIHSGTIFINRVETGILFQGGTS